MVKNNTEENNVKYGYAILSYTFRIKCYNCHTFFMDFEHF